MERMRRAEKKVERFEKESQSKSFRMLYLIFTAVVHSQRLS